MNSERQQMWELMGRPELSLGPSSSSSSSSFAPGAVVGSDQYLMSPESEYSNAYCRKRKSSWEEPSCQTGIELQLKDPLPLDWEQCLDLQSGNMYYMNRKTLKRSWSLPAKNQTLDLELNISPPADGNSPCPNTEERSTSTREENSMVAVVCLKCHLLVMLCRSSPSCPNCKYVHPLPPPQQLAPSKADSRPRSLETLSLLH